MSDDKQRLFFYPSDYDLRHVGVYVERLGVVDGGIYLYYPHIPVKTLERPRPVRVALEALEPAEFDLLNDAGPYHPIDGPAPDETRELPIIEIPTYLRPRVPRSNRRLFQQTFRAPVTVIGAKGQEIQTVATYQFIQEHTRDEDPAPTGYFTDKQRHSYNLIKTIKGSELEARLRGAKDKALVRLENNEALRMLEVANNFSRGDELDKLAELRLRFVSMEQSAASFRKWTGLSERYLAHLDQYISKWWKGSLYPRSENGVLTRVPPKGPRHPDRIIRKAVKTGVIPVESAV